MCKQRNPTARTPAGLIVPIRGVIAGRLRWRVLDERGVPQVPRNPSGFAIGPVDGVRQSNLITNLGMNRFAELSWRTTATTSNGFRRRLAVGTGSTAPDVTDTALDSEVQRAADNGGLSASSSYELDGTANVFRSTVTVPRLVTMTADRNLTEFGLGNETTGDILIRELFRDELGDPVTISLLNGKKILVEHTMTVEIDAPSAGTAGAIDIVEYDAANVLQDTLAYDVVYGPSYWDDGNAGRNTSRITAAMKLWDPSFTHGWSQGYCCLLTSSHSPFARAQSTHYISGSSGSQYQGYDANGDRNGYWGWEAYVADSHQRVRRFPARASELNNEAYGFAFMYGVGMSYTEEGGFACVFDTPTTYQKENTETIRFGFVSSWARAAEGS